MSNKLIDPPDPSRSRLEDEVLEILQRTDSEPGKIIKFKSRAQRERYKTSGRIQNLLQGFALTDTGLLVGAIVLAILAAITNHSSPLLAKLLILGCIVCLGMLFVIAFRRPKGTATKRWRGRDIEFRQSSDLDWRGRFRGPKPPKR